MSYIGQALAVFENHQIRRLYGEKAARWFFSVVDVVAALTWQIDYQTARNYWKVLKNRLKKEGSESVTKCNRLKMTAADGKSYLTDVARTKRRDDPVSQILLPKRHEGKNGINRRKGMLSLHQLLDKIGELDGRFWQ